MEVDRLRNAAVVKKVRSLELCEGQRSLSLCLSSLRMLYARRIQLRDNQLMSWFRCASL